MRNRITGHCLVGGDKGHLGRHMLINVKIMKKNCGVKKKEDKKKKMKKKLSSGSVGSSLTVSNLPDSENWIINNTHYVTFITVHLLIPGGF